LVWGFLQWVLWLAFFDLRLLPPSWVR